MQNNVKERVRDMKLKKMTWLLLVIVIMLGVGSCGKEELKSASDYENTKEDVQKNIQEERINRKAPQRMEELNILSATKITYFLAEEEVTIKDKDKVEDIKEIIANSKINEDTTFVSYEGGILFRIYKGKSVLCEISLAGPDDVGKFMVTNDSYQFFCDINKKDVKKLRSIIE